jgi:FkbM family methyltransferase
LNDMDEHWRYTLRGWAYWTECLNPFKGTITIDDLPLGLKLQAYKRDAVGRGLYRRRVHEPGLTSLLLSRFASPAERNFIDAGANIGYFSALMSKLAGPAGKVLAIEPEPNNLKLLEQNLRINHLANVIVHACALGARESSGMLGLYKPSNRGRHSMVDSESKLAIEVRVRTLDDLAGASGNLLNTWSLVKIDVEGYEGFVLDGAREILPRIETLVMEFSPVLLRKAGSDPASVLRTLSAEFPRIYRIEMAELIPTTAQNISGSENQLELVFER